MAALFEIYMFTIGRYAAIWMPFIAPHNYAMLPFDKTRAIVVNNKTDVAAPVPVSSFFYSC